MKRKMTDFLRSWKADPRKKGLVIVGARQIGKTYVVDEFGRSEYDHYLKIDLDGSESSRRVFRRSIQADDLLDEIRLINPSFKVVPGHSLLFLDEIQTCPDARAAIKPLVQDGRVDVIASGSLLGTLGLKRADDEGIYWNTDDWTHTGFGEYVHNGESESLDETVETEGSQATIRETLGEGRKRLRPVGYEDMVRMFPLDFEEYLWALGYSSEQTTSIRNHFANRVPFSDSTLEALEGFYRQYVVVGGMPDAVLESLANDHAGVMGVHSRINDGYSHDILEYAPSDLRDRVYGCISAIPRNMKRRSRKFRFSDANGKENVGWREYADPLSWIDSSGMVTVCSSVTEPCRPLRTNVGRDFKIYMGDTGLLLARLDASDYRAVLSSESGINVGGITENAVANMLERCGIDLFYFERDRVEPDGTRDRIEVDFIVDLGPDMTAIEVKSGSNRASRSFNKIRTDPRYSQYPITRFIRLSPGNILVDGNGVEHYPLFAAAFMDSMYEAQRVDYKGYEPLDLRIGPDPRRRG